MLIMNIVVNPCKLINIHNLMNALGTYLIRNDIAELILLMNNNKLSSGDTFNFTYIFMTM